MRELGETSTRYAADELKRTESAIRTDHQKAARMLAWLWIRTTVIGLGVCAAIWSSVWALGQWQRRQIEENIELLLHIRREGLSLKQAINALLREGLLRRGRPPKSRKYSTPAKALGLWPGFDPTGASAC